MRTVMQTSITLCVTFVTTFGRACTGCATRSYPSWPLFTPHVYTSPSSVTHALAVRHAEIAHTRRPLSCPCTLRGVVWTVQSDLSAKTSPPSRSTALGSMMCPSTLLRLLPQLQTSPAAVRTRV